MATSPLFIGTPRSGVAQISAANTGRDGSGTVVTVFTAGSSGSCIDRIDIVAAGTTTPGVVRLFIYDGSNYRLWQEVLVSAVTPSTTVEVFRDSIEPSGGLILPNGYSLRASTHNAETFNVVADGGDF